jgi:U2 small nuclear ribonucleoprotein A'
LADIQPLSNCKSLTHLTLLENPIQNKPHYRLWVIWAIPSVRFLDYAKVKLDEREKAAELFGTEKEPTALASKVRRVFSVDTLQVDAKCSQIMGVKSKTFDAGVVAANGTVAGSKNYRVKLSDKERKRVEELIKNAKSKPNSRHLRILIVLHSGFKMLIFSIQACKISSGWRRN